MVGKREVNNLPGIVGHWSIAMSNWLSSANNNGRRDNIGCGSDTGANVTVISSMSAILLSTVSAGIIWRYGLRSYAAYITPQNFWLRITQEPEMPEA
jgi:hypothetical protein